MTQINKFAWSGVSVALALTMALVMFAQVAYAATTTQRADATIAAATNVATGSGVYTELGNIIITESGAGEFAATETIILTTPANWSWDNVGQTVSASGTNGLTASAANTSATVTTVTINQASTGSAGVLTISGLEIRPDTGAAGVTGGDIVASGTAGVTGNVGTISGTPDGNISVVVGGTVAQSGANSTTATAYVFDGANPQTSKSVTFTSSIAGFGTSGTSTAQAFTNGNGVATVTYRGTGTAGTDTVTAQTPAPDQAVGSTTATVGAASAGTPTTLAFVNAWGTGSSGSVVTNVAPSSSSANPSYSSPQTGTNVVFRVTDSTGTGVTTQQSVQITTDKGGLVAFDGTCSTTAPKTIVVNSTTATGFGGSSTSGPGRVGVRFCAGTGEANRGVATITADNITTDMANATTTVTTAGVPATIASTYANGNLEVTVTDADGNAVADGTEVAVTIASSVGSAAPATRLTVDGEANFAVALTGDSGNAIVSVNDTAAGTNRLTQSVSLTPTGTTPPPDGDGTLTAPSFGSGNVGAAVFSGGTVAELSAEVTAAGGTSVWAQTDAGVWVRYNTLATGATAFVNNAFNAAFAAGFDGPTAVFVVK